MQRNEKEFIKNAIIKGVRFLDDSDTHDEEVEFVFAHKSLTNATVCITKNRKNYYLTFYFKKFNGCALETNFKLFNFAFLELEEWFKINETSCEIFLRPNEMDFLSFKILFDAIIYAFNKLEVFDFSGQIQKTGLSKNVVKRTKFINIVSGVIKEKLLFFDNSDKITVINNGTKLERDSCDAILLVYEKNQNHSFYVLKRRSLTYNQMQICMDNENI